MSNKRRRDKKKSRAQKYKATQPRPDYAPIVKENESLFKYYKQQSFLSEGEFDQFVEGLRETLPASFRINTFDLDQAKFLRDYVQGPQFSEFLTAPVSTSNGAESTEGAQDNAESEAEQASKKAKLVHVVGKPPALEPLSWYPQKFGWQLNITRLDIKKTPVLQQLHKFLMAETDNGFISRQEAVSMIPPLLLDVHRGQDIMDMCAAPGSKTAQLLEYLKYDIMSSGEHAKQASPEDFFDDGMVVANDVDNKRCYMLVHQSSRLNSPNCIIINQDASALPDMKAFVKDNDEQINIKFDRILCDVPCSGDGTVRKNPDVWKKWSVGNANNFHGMQCKILRRGIELLKENGLLVYSTCSMNPVEDEAVIATILRASQSKVVLEDIANKLPGLKHRPGVTKWVVMNKDLEIIPSVDKVPPEYSTQIYPSLFPPTDEENKQFNLHRCLRILPHLQNTGGFFVAVLRKVSSNLPWDEQKKEPRPVSSSAPKKRRFAGFKEDPFIFMDNSDPDWGPIKNGYGLSENFPVGQLVHRCKSGKKRSIYLVSKKTANFIKANQEEPGRENFVKIINGGMRLFTRADTGAGFRLCQDGVSQVLPYIKDTIKVPINKEDLIALLQAKAVPFDALSSSQQIKDLIEPGSFILIFKQHKENGDSDGTIEMPLVAWKGAYTIALYVSRTFKVHLCALVGLTMPTGTEEEVPEQEPAKDEN